MDSEPLVVFQRARTPSAHGRSSSMGARRRAPWFRMSPRHRTRKSPSRDRVNRRIALGEVLTFPAPALALLTALASLRGAGQQIATTVIDVQADLGRRTQRAHSAISATSRGRPTPSRGHGTSRCWCPRERSAPMRERRTDGHAHPLHTTSAIRSGAHTFPPCAPSR